MAAVTEVSRPDICISLLETDMPTGVERLNVRAESCDICVSSDRHRDRCGDRRRVRGVLHVLYAPAVAASMCLFLLLRSDKEETKTRCVPLYA